MGRKETPREEHLHGNSEKDKPSEGFRSKHFSLKEQSRLRPLKRETGWNGAGISDASVTILIILYVFYH